MSDPVATLPFVDVTDDAFVADPRGVLEPLLPAAWIARSERGYEVFSYAGVEAAYQAPHLVAGVMQLMRDMGLDPDALAGGGGNLQGTEGPDHTRFRRVVSKWFTPRRVDELRPRVRALVESRLDSLASASGGEFMGDVATRVPGAVFCWMIGAPEDRADEVFGLSEVILRAFAGDFSEAEAIMNAAVEMRVLVDELIEEKRRRPDDALLSIMLDAAAAGDITIEDVHSLAFEMLSASTDNTAHSAGLILATLARHPDQWQLLRDDRSLVPGAVEECLRVEPRVRYDTAYTEAGGRLLDIELPPGTMVYQHITVAHVDPEVYPDPHRFDVTRRHARPQLNFGIGRHYCLGAALARMELQAILEVTLERWSTVELGPGVLVAPLAGRVESLPLVGTPAGS